MIDKIYTYSQASHIEENFAHRPKLRTWSQVQKSSQTYGSPANFPHMYSQFQKSSQKAQVQSTIQI